MAFVNTLNEKKYITKYKTIIDYATEYIKRENTVIGMIESINHIRIFKKILLPCELVGFKHEIETKELKNVFGESLVL